MTNRDGIETLLTYNNSRFATINRITYSITFLCTYINIKILLWFFFFKELLKTTIFDTFYGLKMYYSCTIKVIGFM